MAGFNITVAGDSAINLEFGNVISEKTNGIIRAAAQTLEADPIDGVIELVPTFCSLMVVYNPCVIGYDELTSQVRGKLRGLVAATGGIHRVVKIPVCYGGDFGPDLSDVAEHAGMSVEEVIAIHSGHDYLIDMLGFLPGFAYLGGLDERLHTPRLATPRTRIEPGAVGIGGAQTGIYPLASPGGWRIIGRTPVRPYDPDRESPILYAAGDYLRFVPITPQEFSLIETQVEAGTYECEIVKGRATTPVQADPNNDQAADSAAWSEGCEASERSATAPAAAPQVDNALQPQTHFSPAMPNVGIAGARANAEIKRILEAHGVNIAFDITCTNTIRRFVPRKTDTLAQYAHDVLTQLPCARMRNISPRKAFFDQVLPQVDGLVYHAVQFCDMYSYEYSDLKRTSPAPILALETDCTAQSRGQMLTRLEAFLESIGASQTEHLASQKGSPMSTAATFVVGLDSGSTSTNAVVMNEARKIVASVVIRTGAKAGASAERAYREVLERAGITPDQVACTIATGYGRVSIPFADENVTEISCHGRGAHYFNPDVRTILDIGGQDSKAIHVNAAGEVTDFAMNDKCAAGTGRFLEMIARSLEISLDELGPAALESKKRLEIASMCSVFAESEVISLIANNEEKPDIAAGVCRAVAGKAYSLMRRVGLEGAYMMTGGVAQNPGVVRAVEELIGEKLFICEDPEIVGATGAALLALEKSE